MIQESTINLAPSHMRFSGGLAGKSIQFTYQNIAFKICFPNFAHNTDSPMLELKGSDILLNRDESDSHELVSAISWGDDKQSVIIFRSSQLIVQNEITKDDDPNSIKSILADWAKELVDWYATELFLDPSYSGSRATNIENVTSFLVSRDKDIEPSYVEQISPIQISGEITEKQLDEQRLKSFLTKISDNEKPEPSKLMLIEALTAFNQLNYRSAVLNSATALEMDLVSRIEAISRSGSDENVALCQFIFNRTGIVDKVKALKKAGANFSENQIRTKIAEPRNKAIHRGTITTEEEAKSALDSAYQILYN